MIYKLLPPTDERVLSSIVPFDIEEFKKQLPDTSKVLSENEVTDERGSRYLLVGTI